MKEFFSSCKQSIKKNILFTKSVNISKIKFNCVQKGKSRVVTWIHVQETINLFYKEENMRILVSSVLNACTWAAGVYSVVLADGQERTLRMRMIKE